jgi:hypothetical protein
MVVWPLVFKRYPGHLLNFKRFQCLLLQYFVMPKRARSKQIDFDIKPKQKSINFFCPCERRPTAPTVYLLQKEWIPLLKTQKSPQVSRHLMTHHTSVAIKSLGKLT